MAKLFYEQLFENPGSYHRAFNYAKKQVREFKKKLGRKGKPWPHGTPYFLSQGHDPASDDYSEDEVANAPEEVEVIIEDEPEEAGGGGFAGASAGSHGPGGLDRSLNNSKGQYEMAGLEALGFALMTKGNQRFKLQDGIDLYEKGTIAPGDKQGLFKYGLKESKKDKSKGGGRKLLFMTSAAMKDIFGAQQTYESLWKVNGPLVQKAQAPACTPNKRELALKNFRKSIRDRMPATDAAHQKQLAVMQSCCTEIEDTDRPPKASSPLTLPLDGMGLWNVVAPR
ncbi:hypothetical protein T484DRAFT_2607873 [Baffinella frigidus]|nr:hypothetical protein T484DRAFT_2607873 [Cryptophyta sp. CCMP2293]